MSILYTTIRTLIIDKVINAFFDNLVTSFSQFDLLNGIREFDELLIFHGGTVAFRFKKCEVISIFIGKNGRFPMQFSYIATISNNVTHVRISVTKILSVSETSLSVEA